MTTHSLVASAYNFKFVNMLFSVFYMERKVAFF